MKRLRDYATRQVMRDNEKLRAELDSVRSELEAERRRLAVANCEIETLAAVIARDRERIKSESAAYARIRADAEGTNERHQQGIS